MKRVLLFLLLAQSVGFAQGPILSGTVYVPGKLVVEPARLPPLPEVFTLTFVDSQDRVATVVTLREDIKTSSYTSTRGGLQGNAVLWPDGTFLVLLRAGEYRTLIRKEPAPGVTSNSASRETYYVKAVSRGSRDLLKQPLIVKASDEEAIVITLAKCTEEARLQC